MEISLNPVWFWPWIVVVAAGLLALSYWTYRPDTPGRKLLLALRWLAVLLVIAVLLRPSLAFTRQQSQVASIVLLADKSKSMLLRDMWDDQSRWEALVRLLKESDDSLKKLEEQVRVRVFSFSSKLGDSLDADKAPEGHQTAIGGALQEVLQRTAGDRLASVVLLSDGANTTGASPSVVARQFASYKVPVHTFGFGRETAGDRIRDVAARSITASGAVFAKNKMTVRGDFQAAGFATQPIAVRLLVDGVEKDRKELQFARGSERATIDLSTIPEVAGDVKVTLKADPQPGELLSGNNEVSTYVTVMAGGISVLEIEGKYRYWEPKFLRWALDQSPDVELSQLFLLDSAGRNQELPKDMLQPGRFDVMILGDVPRNRFTDDQLRQLAERVQKGMGLLMMGGYESFGPGGWGDSPLAEILPAVVRTTDAQIKTPIKFTPTAAGIRHFILRIAPTPEANQTAWQALRPLDGANSWSGLKPGAILLASGPEGAPLLASQDVAAGRVLCFAADTSWRWRRDPTGAAAHARFWRQMILWLAHKEEGAGTNIRVRLAQRRLAIGQRLPIDVNVEDETGAPIADAQVQAVVETPDKKQIPVELFRQQDGYRGAFWQTDSEGDYTVKVVATAGGKSLGSRTVKFLTYAEDAEMMLLAADIQGMRNLAQLTSGEFHTPEDLPKFLETLARSDLTQKISQPVYESLWDRWPTLLVFICIVSAEWILRKRKGLP